MAKRRRVFRRRRRGYRRRPRIPKPQFNVPAIVPSSRISNNPRRSVNPNDQMHKRTIGLSVQCATGATAQTLTLSTIVSALDSSSARLADRCISFRYIYCWSSIVNGSISGFLNQEYITTPTAVTGTPANGTISQSDQGTSNSLAKIGWVIPYTCRRVITLNSTELNRNIINISHTDPFNNTSVDRPIYIRVGLNFWM